MSRKLVGITCSTSPAAPGENHRQCLNTAYARAVMQAGGVPVIIPNCSDVTDEIAMAYLNAIDGLLLSGGVDLSPALYGENNHPHLGVVDAARDKMELALLEHALASETPIFGICRGIQCLNVAMGGSLYQHLPDDAPGSIHHQQAELDVARGEFSHAIEVDSGSRLREIVGTGQMQTNSFHHQAVKSLAPGLKVTARAPDGIVEAVEAPGHRYLVAVQFHPEETAPHDERSHRLFEAFVQAL